MNHKSRRVLIFISSAMIFLVLLLLSQSNNTILKPISTNSVISPEIIYNPSRNLPKEQIPVRRYYAWIPHFDFVNALNSNISQMEKIEEIHFAGAYVNEEGYVSYSSNFETSLSTLNNKGIYFGVNIFSKNYSHVKRFLENGYANIINITKDLKSKYSYFSTLNLNLESLHKKDAPFFLNFINSLNTELDKYNINLFVSVFAPSVRANNFMLTLDGLSDMNSLIGFCDKLVLLFYDYSLHGNGIGNSPLPWLENTISGISTNLRDKIIIGLPLYGYEFNTQNHVLKSYTYAQIQRLSGYANVQIDTASDEPYFFNSENKVYFMDKSTLNNRKNVAAKYGVNNFFFWRLGGDNGIWID